MLSRSCGRCKSRGCHSYGWVSGSPLPPSPSHAPHHVAEGLSKASSPPRSPRAAEAASSPVQILAECAWMGGEGFKPFCSEDAAIYIPVLPRNGDCLLLYFRRP